MIEINRDAQSKGNQSKVAERSRSSSRQARLYLQLHLEEPKILEPMQKKGSSQTVFKEADKVEQQLDNNLLMLLIKVQECYGYWQ